LKLKSLAVLTVLTFFVLGCSAAFAQGSATLGYTSAGDLEEYCNYEQISWGGYDNFYAQGTDNNSACGIANNGTMVGLKISVPASAVSPVVGSAYAFADNTIDAQYGSYTGEQWYVVTLLKPSKILKKFGWAGYLGLDGYEYLGNYGYLTATIPSVAGGKKISTMTAAGAAHQSQTKTKTINK
jgi:hypothetical protein